MTTKEENHNSQVTESFWVKKWTGANFLIYDPFWWVEYPKKRLTPESPGTFF